MKSLARTLRRNSTDAEQRLWQHLRNRQVLGYKFRRQVVIEPYIVDFICLQTKLIIEADGGQHAQQIHADEKRSAALRAKGFHVMRFWNHDILNNTDNVLAQIYHYLNQFPSP